MDGLMDELVYRRFYLFLQTVYPGFVATAMSGIRRPRVWSPSPESYVSSAVATIGVQNETYGCIAHAIQVSCVCVCVMCIDDSHCMYLYITNSTTFQI